MNWIYAAEAGLGERLTDPTVLVALIAAVIGGLGLKVLEKFLNRKKEAADLATVIRNELRQDMAALRAEVQQHSAEADTWQQKYWEQVEANAALKSQVSLLDYKVKRMVTIITDHYPQNEWLEDFKNLK